MPVVIASCFPKLPYLGPWTRLWRSLESLAGHLCLSSEAIERNAPI
jgi:hypothetical protein